MHIKILQKQNVADRNEIYLIYITNNNNTAYDYFHQQKKCVAYVSDLGLKSAEAYSSFQYNRQ